MGTNGLGIDLAVTFVVATRCASTQRPMLYPNATLTRVASRRPSADEGFTAP